MKYEIKILNQFILMVFLISCSSEDLLSEDSKESSKAYYIARNPNEVRFKIEEPKQIKRDLYSWENLEGVHYPKITKEFFRCKGSSSNPIQKDKKKNVMYPDCDGNSRHSLPLIGDKEAVYPILIDLLNFIQNQTKKKVVVTCGHRCPTHNIYADRSTLGRVSKHMIGAEVDFYVKGLEEKPEEVVEIIFQYYQQTSYCRGDAGYQKFQRYTKADAHTKIHPWYNKEIYMKLVGADEGRDFDNRHPYPYINIQVRFDRKANKKVSYSWEKANRGYIRW